MPVCLRHPECSNSSTKWTSTVPSTLAFASYKFYVLVMINNDFLIRNVPTHESSIIDERAFFVYTFCLWGLTSAVGLLMLAVRVRRAHKTSDEMGLASKRMFAIWSVVSFLSTISLSILMILNQRFLLVMASVGIASLAITVVHWFWIYTSCFVSARFLLRTLVVGQLCASSAFYVVKAMGMGVQVGSLLLSVPILIGATGYILRKGDLTLSSTDSDGCVRRVDGDTALSMMVGNAKYILLSIVISTFAVGILWGSSVTVRDHALWVYGAIAVGIVYLTYTDFFKRDIRESAILQAVFIILGIAILLAILIPMFTDICMGLVWAGYSMLSLAIFLIGYIGQPAPVHMLFERSLALSLFAFSIGSGLAAGYAMFLYAPAVEAPSVVACVLLLTITLFFGKQTRALDAAGKYGVQVMGEADVPSDPVDEIAKKFNLTAAERETLFYILKGYAIWRISEERSVSSNTVKTQVSSVYRKIGVHSKQELLKVIEGIGK